jgi:MvdD pre-ATP grasp domain
MERVLVLTRDGDTPAVHVAGLLRERGVDVILFDPADFPSRAHLSVIVTSSGHARRFLVASGETIDLDTLTALWFSRPREPVPHRRITDPTTRMYVAHECAAFSADVWDTLECRMVPASGHITRYAARKTTQLLHAARLGFEVPRTLVTTDPDRLLDFYCEHDGRIISKVLEQFGTYAGDDDFCRFTEPVSTRDLGHVDDMSLSPVIVQPYVDKALELRVTVVGSRVFATEIHSQKSNHARLDWRRYDLKTTPHRPHDLPVHTANRCVRLVEELGLCYGALDLVLTPDGRYVFLEINPAGQYRWIEKATGLPISEALCDLLLGTDEAQAMARREVLR